MEASTTCLNYTVHLYAAFTVRVFCSIAVIYNCKEDIITFCQVWRGKQTNTLKEQRLLLRTLKCSSEGYLIKREHFIPCTCRGRYRQFQDTIVKQLN